MKLTRKQAIKILDEVIDESDTGWEIITMDYEDDESDDPNISAYDVFLALGVSKKEYENATGNKATYWPEQ
mgnify:CR=1 FL=1